MSGLSPGQAAVPVQGELMDLIEHIFLPPDAGKRDDNAYNTPEFRADMVASLHRSLDAFEMLVTGPAAAAISRCKRMINRLEDARSGAGQLQSQAIQDLLSDLPHNGERNRPTWHFTSLITDTPSQTRLPLTYARKTQPFWSQKQKTHWWSNRLSY
jgi:hypothetical protein